MNTQQRRTLYDGLVLVHPDYLFGFDEKLPARYTDALWQAVTEYQEQSRRVFLYPSIHRNDGELHLHPELRELLKDAIIVPKQPRYDHLSEEENVSLHSQADVDFMAQAIGKQPKDTIVAFDGIISDACVYAIARWTCSRVQTNYPGELLWRSKAPRKFRQGKVLDDLVMHITSRGAPTFDWEP